MFNKIIDIANYDCSLCIENRLLVIDCKNEKTKIPVKEISILLISNEQTVLTGQVLAAFAQNNASVIVCNSKFMPVSMLLPTESNFKQAEKFIKQSEVSLPVKKRIWKEVIIAKIWGQAYNLELFCGEDFGLNNYGARVNSGDTENLEAQAARIYWPKIFGSEFIRDRTLNNQNALLNYGYMVLRAIIARSICSVGLHPTLGIHHHNQLDAFCLADDMMEPFRFLVDRFVVNYIKTNKTHAVDVQFKKSILEYLMGKFKYDNAQRGLFDISLKVSENLVNCFYDSSFIFKIHQIKDV